MSEPTPHEPISNEPTSNEPTSNESPANERPAVMLVGACTLSVTVLEPLGGLSFLNDLSQTIKRVSRDANLKALAESYVPESFAYCLTASEKGDVLTLGKIVTDGPKVKCVDLANLTSPNGKPISQKTQKHLQLGLIALGLDEIQPLDVRPREKPPTAHKYRSLAAQSLE